MSRKKIAQPVVDKFSERFLDKGRELYEAGDKSELLYCLSYCVRYHDVPIPEWLRGAFSGAYHEALMHRIDTWDDVFGKPLGNGKKFGRGKSRKKAERDLRLGPRVLGRVIRRYRAGQAINDEMFEAIGRDLKIGKNKAKELYSEQRNQQRDWGNEKKIINREVNFGMFRKLK
jgi:hypothetical protein